MTFYFDTIMVAMPVHTLTNKSLDNLENLSIFLILQYKVEDRGQWKLVNFPSGNNRMNPIVYQVKINHEQAQKEALKNQKWVETKQVRNKYLVLKSQQLTFEYLKSWNIMTCWEQLTENGKLKGILESEREREREKGEASFKTNNFMTQYQIEVLKSRGSQWGVKQYGWKWWDEDTGLVR